MQPEPAAEAIEPAPDEQPEVEEQPVGKQMPMDLEREVGSWRHASDGWQLPPIDALAELEPTPLEGGDQQRRAELIVETLASFGVEASVTQINEGPAVTQFGVEPGWDVRTRTVVERNAEGEQVLDEDGQPRTKQIEISRTRIRVSRVTSLQNRPGARAGDAGAADRGAGPGQVRDRDRGAERAYLDRDVARGVGVARVREGGGEVSAADRARLWRLGCAGGRGPRGDAAPADRGGDRGGQVGVPELDHRLLADELLAGATAAGADRPETGGAGGVRERPASGVSARSSWTWTRWSERCRRRSTRWSIATGRSRSWACATSRAITRPSKAGRCRTGWW